VAATTRRGNPSACPEARGVVALEQARRKVRCMGRGDLAKVRSAKDRQRKVKEREKKRAGERGAARKAAKKR